LSCALSALSCILDATPAQSFRLFTILFLWSGPISDRWHDASKLLHRDYICARAGRVLGRGTFKDGNQGHREQECQNQVPHAPAIPSQLSLLNFFMVDPILVSAHRALSALLHWHFGLVPIFLTDSNSLLFCHSLLARNCLLHTARFAPLKIH